MEFMNKVIRMQNTLPQFIIKIFNEIASNYVEL